MFDYTQAYLSPFPWAKIAYDYSLGLVSVSQTEITQQALTSPIVNQLSTTPITIQTDADWNNATHQHMGTLAALYQSLDQAEAYIQNLYTKLDSRLLESERRTQENEQSLKSLRSTLGLSSTTNITVKGGDITSIDPNPQYYKDTGLLRNDERESVFRLADTGSFSSIRSLGGFAGQVVIERQLGHLVEIGPLSAVTDGGRATFWMGTHYAPTPMRVDNNDVPWVPDAYKHGYALMITYYLDRPTLASEVFLDPVTTEPFHLISVSYTPYGIQNILITPTFEVTGNWVYNPQTSRAQGLGVDNSYALLCVAPSGFASQTFSLIAALNKSISGLMVPATSGDVLDSRVELLYNMKGRGDCKAGARIVWLDALGNIISYKLRQDFPVGFFQTLRLVDYAPAQAVSGRIDLGIFTATTQASAMFDDAVLCVGEQRKSYNEIIDRPKTVLIRNKSGAVLSNRFSFVLAQTNPHREILSKESASNPLQVISGLLDVDPTLQKATVSLADSFLNKGPGESIFAYRLGLKELDLLYREFVPRGALVTYPLKTLKEVRRMWLTTETDQSDTQGATFYIYPFSSDQNYRVALNPYRIGDLNETQFSTGIGDILYVYTKEEIASGWAQAPAGSTLIVDPKPIRETFDGTDREGKITLGEAPHIRRPELLNIINWLDKFSVKPGIFDPNSELLVGVVNDDIRNKIRSGSVSGLSVPASAYISRAGYLPMRVTVKTDKWVAYQDIFGNPDSGFVQYVENEELQTTTVTDTITNVTDNIIGFEAWLNTYTLRQAAEDNPVPSNPFFNYSYTESAKAIFNDPVSKFLNNGYFSRGWASPYGMFVTYLQKRYDYLKSQGQIPKDTNEVRTSVSTVAKHGAYKTKYSPVVVGPAGLFLQLFWYDSTNNLYLAVPRADYKVQTNIGVVLLQRDPPSDSYDKLLANYWYLSDTNQEDFSSRTLSYLTQTSSSMAEAHSHAGSRSRTYPSLRNRTDYQHGKVPEFNIPDFDPLSRTYFPVIEYYVTSDSQIVFSRDFFKYGDLPAQIIVEYYSLGLNPRAGVVVERGGSPTASNLIRSLSLFVKESSTSPTRSVE